MICHLRTRTGHLSIDGSRDSGSSQGHQPLASPCRLCGMEQKESKSLSPPSQGVLWLGAGMGTPRAQPCRHSRSLQTGPP